MGRDADRQAHPEPGATVAGSPERPWIFVDNFINYI